MLKPYLRTDFENRIFNSERPGAALTSSYSDTHSMLDASDPVLDDISSQAYDLVQAGIVTMDQADEIQGGFLWPLTSLKLSSSFSPLLATPIAAVHSPTPTFRVPATALLLPYPALLLPASPPHTRFTHPT